MKSEFEDYKKKLKDILSDESNNEFLFDYTSIISKGMSNMPKNKKSILLIEVFKHEDDAFSVSRLGIIADGTVKEVLDIIEKQER